MSDPNNNPRPGSGNLVWIIVAVVVVIGVIWYVMRDTTPTVTTEPPAAVSSQPATGTPPPAATETPAPATETPAPAGEAPAPAGETPAAPASN